MNNCTNDWTPVIAGIGTLLTIQVPAIIAMLLNQYKMKHDIGVSKALSYGIDRKQDIQTVILKNGYHGAPGAPGRPGRDGNDYQENIEE